MIQRTAPVHSSPLSLSAGALVGVQLGAEISQALRQALDLAGTCAVVPAMG